ncbi:MAG: hypothetical protein KH703_02245 [Campylobacter gracilis]|nr:hypothetical protein [Campylobacter gracilis]
MEFTTSPSLKFVVGFSLKFMLRNFAPNLKARPSHQSSRQNPYQNLRQNFKISLYRAVKILKFWFANFIKFIKFFKILSSK